MLYCEVSNVMHMVEFSRCTFYSYSSQQLISLEIASSSTYTVVHSCYLNDIETFKSNNHYRNGHDLSMRAGRQVVDPCLKEVKDSLIVFWGKQDKNRREIIQALKLMKLPVRKTLLRLSIYRMNYVIGNVMK